MFDLYDDIWPREVLPRDPDFLKITRQEKKIHQNNYKIQTTVLCPAPVARFIPKIYHNTCWVHSRVLSLLSHACCRMHPQKVHFINSFLELLHNITRKCYIISKCQIHRSMLSYGLHLIHIFMDQFSLPLP